MSTVTANVKSSLLGAGSVVCAALLMAGQAVLWATAGTCQFTHPKVNTAGKPGFFGDASPAIFAVFVLFGALYNRKPVQDMSFVVFVHWFMMTAPLFTDENNATQQKGFMALWQSSTSLLFSAALLYILLFVHAVTRAQQAAQAAQAERLPPVPYRQHLKRFPFLLLLGCSAAAAAAAAVVYVTTRRDFGSSTFESNRSYFYASVALVIPLLCMWSDLGRSKGLHLVALALSLAVGGQVAFGVTASSGGWGLSSGCRGAFIVLLVTGTLAPVLRMLKPLESSNELLIAASGRYRGVLSVTTPLAIPVWMLLAAFSWNQAASISLSYVTPFYLYPALLIIGTLTALVVKGDDDSLRLIFYELLLYVVSPSIWPLSGTSTQSFVTVGLLVMALWYIGCVAAEDDDDMVFVCLHSQRTVVTNASLSAAMVEKNPMPASSTLNDGDLRAEHEPLLKPLGDRPPKSSGTFDS